MKIAYIAAGAAGMYCGSCLHDNTLAAALLKQGQDVLLVPTYTPLRTDSQDVSLPRVFMGGLNVYLQQASPLFRWTPRWLANLLDRPALLNYVTRGAASVDPARLGALTISMLEGDQGRQAKELEKLVDWLTDEVRPDVVHLSNSMLLGMARRIRDRSAAPVVCALSGEDLFIEALRPPHYQRARDLLREHAGEVQAFTTLNAYYADFMADYLSVDRQKIHVIPHGLDLASHPSPARRESPAGSPPTIGYLARICPDKGLHLLVEACRQLAETHPELDFALKAAGYLGKGDRPYLDQLLAENRTGLLAGRFAYLGELDRAGKHEFLRSLSVFSTPTVYRESKGLPAIEALAAGVPLVLPDHGSFPEFVAHTGGGLLFPPGDAGALANQLGRLLTEPPLAQQLGQSGRQMVYDYYHAERMARQTLQLYRKL